MNKINNRRAYKKNLKYNYKKNKITLDDVIDNYNDILKKQSNPDFLFWYKLTIPVIIAVNIMELLNLRSFRFLNFFTGISGLVGSAFILYSILKNTDSRTDLTRKLIVPSSVILFFSLSLIHDTLIDGVIILFPVFLVAFIIYYIKKSRKDSSVRLKSFNFFMNIFFKVLYILLTACFIFILLFIFYIPMVIFKEKDAYGFLRMLLLILNLFNIIYYFKLNFLNNLKISFSNISQNDLFILEKEAESRQKKRYFLGMEFNKIYFSAFGFFIIPIIKNFLDYIKRKNNLTLENSISDFFKEYGNIFSMSVILFIIIVSFVLIFDNMSYLSRNTIFKNIAKVLAILIEEKMSSRRRFRKLF